MIMPARRAVPVDLLDFVTRRSVDLFVQTEDIPLPDNRISVNASDQIVVEREASNVSSHRELIRRMKHHVHAAGYPVVLTERLGITATAHQCGTARMGVDPATSVVDPQGRAHDIANLWLCDASTMPSSAAVNPALTVAALALRLGASGTLVEH
jgi:choline dehydrogenase-like flavoprotein